MTADEAVVAVLDALEAAGMPYMIVGSLASNFHGIAHDRERFSRRQRVNILGRVAFVATAEDMIVTKLRWAAEHGTAGLLEQIRGSIPPA